MCNARKLSLCTLLAAAVLAVGCQNMGADSYRAQSPDPQIPGTSTSIARGLDEEGTAPTEKDASPVVDFWYRITSWARPEPNEAEARTAYNQGDELFAQKKYEEALEKYETAATLWPASRIEEDSMFMIGECYFFLDEYPDASDAYGELMAKYGNTRHMDRCSKRLFLIAQYWQGMYRYSPQFSLTPNLLDDTRPLFDTGGYSLTTYQAIWTKDPRGPLADDAVMQTANSYFLDEDWHDADRYYEQVRKDYYDSPHIVQAFLLGYQSKLRAYQGPKYDGAPLEQAGELIETLLMQFSKELGPELERVQQHGKLVQAMKAERLWTRAEYYRNRGENQAAAMNYRKLVEDYPGTDFARAAGEQLQGVAGLPPEPPQYFGWLIKVFPEPNNLPTPIGEQGKLR